MATKKTTQGHRPELRARLREYACALAEAGAAGRPLTREMIADGVRKLTPEPVKDDEITSLIAWAVDQGDLRAREDKTLQRFFYTFA